MKKKIAILTSVILILTLTVFGITIPKRSYAKSAQMHIEVPESVKKENEFTVSVVLQSDVQLYSVDAYLSYDPNLLEFIPDENYVTGADGVLELKDTFMEETTQAVYNITFKPLDVGTVEIALTDVYLIDYEDLDYIPVTPSVAHFDIGINHSVSEDARLADLIVAPGEFTETFNPDILNYEMYVDLNVTQIGVSAIPMAEDSVITLDMPEVLVEGKNEIRVTVTALSGNVNEYKIVVYRQKNEKSSDEMSVDDSITDDEEERTQDNQSIEESQDTSGTLSTEEEQNTEEEQSVQDNPNSEEEQNTKEEQSIQEEQNMEENQGTQE